MLLTLVVLPAPAGGVAEHRAAVVVDTGAEVKTARITFTADSISGVEALELAGMDPLVRGYGGQGAAVCALCGRGCPADGTCLTCGGANYWAYFRAVGGATSYRYSPVGAGATAVHDGDVEAWKWGPGVPPAFHSFAELWGESPTTTTATTSPPVTSAPPTTARVEATTAPTTAAPGASPTTAAAAGSSGTTAAATTPTIPTTAGPAVAGATGTHPETSSGGDVRGDGGGTAGATTSSGVAAAGTESAPTTGEGGGADPPSTVERGPALSTSVGADVQPVAVAPLVARRDTGGSWGGVVLFGFVAAGLVAWIVRSRRRRQPVLVTER